jgi:predicted dehydrogenase
VGEENRLAIRVYGTTGSIEWLQEDPNFLYVRYPDRAMEVYKPGHAHLVAEAQRGTRMPAGHPEGLLEAFANIYANAIRVISARRAGETPDPLDLDFPTVRDGATGVHFIQAALRSGRERDWVDASYTAPGA